MRGIYVLRIFHLLGSVFVRRQQMELVISDGVPDSKGVIFSVGCFRSTADDMSFSSPGS